ncbi:Coenzyme F420 hydrogenase/dehydrogenase, beta subunit C-terminal domain [Niabella drilacis]|uniref:Coenzyme F420-reducing hydrogenase, beta subunit n=1 Tax=Niabella drilacis (strain DSM 25811 / CCM 8410 / CCUG 62505 / LMG 26954 / E90) TaxID=1285928 RepID=A0A1G6LL96_NIADE|nr:Coenzyme F420 hydrogenase/dehydrogenase, beta subunit C-terminal domain [Niabella drilacis]SDC44088.1 Coenzyme F420-reducing hydrogenase, beta subunit [Niabella drilacis]
MNLFNGEFCTGCGLCVSESEQVIKMDWDEYGFLKPVTLHGNMPGEAMKVCPFNPKPEDAIADEDKLAGIYLKEAAQFDPEIGCFENTYIGYSRNWRSTSSSGGMATYIFEQLLQLRIVDHLYIVKEVNGSYAYQLFSNETEIKETSKTRYIPVTLEDLFINIGNIEGKVAVSGVACFIKAIRLKQYYYPELRDKIPFLIGIICGGWKSSFFTDFLAQSSGIDGDYRNQEYRIKDANSTASDYSFGAYDGRGAFYQMKMSRVGDMWGSGLFKSKACDFCTDVLTELADISLGDAWLPECRSDGMGNSIIITRTLLADQLIREGMERDDLCVQPAPKSRIIESQRPSFSHRRDGLKFRIRMAKLQGCVLPYVRKRVLRPISISYSIVQLQRSITRSESLEQWRAASSLEVFNRKMNKALKRLRFVTRVYHKMRKFKIS